MKKKLIKFSSLALVMSLILGLGIFSVGCKDSKNKKIEVTFWEEDDPGNVDTAWDEIIKDFEEQNENVKVVRSHVTIESLRQNFQNAVIGGGGPSIVAGPDDNIGIFGTAQTALQLDDVFSKEFLDTMDSKYIDGARLDGNLYGIPYVTGNTIALLYNKDVIEKAPETMSELIEMAKKFTEGNDKKGLVFNMTAPYNYIGFLGAYGGKVLDEYNNITLDTAEMKKTVEYLYSLRGEYEIVPAECSYDQASNLFKTGDAAFIINGPWAFEEYKKAGINLGVTCIPKVDDADYPTPYVSSKVLMLNRNLTGDKLEMAKKFIEFACNKQNQLRLANVINEFPTNKEAMEDMTAIANDELKSLKEQIDKCIPMPIVPKMRAVWDGMTPTFQKVWSGKINSTAAIREMQKTAEEKAKALGE